jgi:dTMP kinase
MLARLLPSILFGPFAGVLIDRFDRKKIMVRADIGRGLLYASMPFMPGLWAIVLLSFVIECLSLLWTPAKDASLPNLVPRRQLANANSVGLVTTYGTLPLGALVYTTLAGVSAGLGSDFPYFASHPEFLALWLDAFTFLFSAWMVSGLDLRSGASARVRAASTPKLDVRGAVREVRAGFRFLGEHPLVRAMTLGIVMAFGGVGAVISLGPIFARYSLNAGSTGFGFLVIGLGIGMGIGMASMGLFNRVLEKEMIFYGAMLGAAACLFVLASMPTLLLATLWTIPMGVGVGLTWVTGYTMLQENVTDEFRGRTFATLTVSARFALFVALALFPALAAAIGSYTWTIAGRQADVSGTRIAIYLAGAVVVAAGLISRRGLKRHRVAHHHPLAVQPKFHKRGSSGLFVVFEGVEGAGKGTQIELARDYVKSRGLEVVVTREPGGTGFGDRVRETILDPAVGRIDPRAEALMFAAARAHLVSTVIRPALESGKVVLCDRFVDSSVAYQGVARGLGEQDVLTLNAWATQGLFPDMVILLHLEPEAGLARAGDDLDRIEAEDLEFHAKVADAYLKIAEESPDRFRVVDAAGSTEEVAKRVQAVLDEAIGQQAEGPA